MIRKYVVIKSVNDEMVELVANRIFDDKVHADSVCESQREMLVEDRMARPLANEGDRALAAGAAKSFIKVYELVATELN